MGKKWDYDVPSQEIWEECLRVLKPGGYLLAFAGTRTQHRMAVRIEDAGFEIRDMIAWIYGSGFPKSLNISKAISKMSPIEDRLEEFANILKQKRSELKLSITDADKIITGGSTMYSFIEGRNLNGVRTIYKPNKEFYLKIVELYGINGFEDIIENTLEVTGTKIGNYGYQKDSERWVENSDITIATTDEAKEWEGFGTSLKPALEPITVARKPLSESTVAKNVLKWGTGGLDIDGSRVPTEEDRSRKGGGDPGMWSGKKQITSESHLGGRFPANLIIDGSEEVVSLFPNTKSGVGTIGTGSGTEDQEIYGKGKGGTITSSFGDSGSAARFFYCAKASKSERGDVETKHPTVKPVALMEYLIGLVSRKGSVILDPFGGSGTTAIACLNKNRDYILMEKDPEYFKIIESRIASRLQQMKPVVKAQLSIFPDADPNH